MGGGAWVRRSGISEPVLGACAPEALAQTPWEDDVHLVVRKGLWAAFPDLGRLRDWAPYVEAGGSAERASGAPLLERLLREAVTAWCADAPADGQAMSALLGLNHRGRRVLNGPGGLRAAAGRRLNHVGWDQFARRYEGPLVARFAAFLRDGAAAGRSTVATSTSLSFSDMERAAVALHQRLERQIRPDLIITLSGPGSFTACYLMRLNVRDLPVVMATTFPVRGQTQETERLYAKVARAAGCRHLRTSKWSIYLPAVLAHLPRRCRIAVVDDRVLSGETLSLIRREVEALGHQVACAALFADPAASVPGLVIGREVSGPFELPWGSVAGRD